MRTCRMGFIIFPKNIQLLYQVWIKISKVSQMIILTTDVSDEH